MFISVNLGLARAKVGDSSVVSKVFDLILVRVVTYLTCFYVHFDYLKDRSGIWDTGEN